MSAESHVRRAWAKALRDRAQGPVPVYGSPEWVALPDGPEKVAACVAAAERCVYQDEITDLETTATARWLTHLHDLAEQGDWEARQQYHRRSWTGQAFRPDPAIDAEVEAEFDAWARGDVA